MLPKPSVSRDVHYVSHGSPVLPDGTQVHPSACRAAKITEVYDPDAGVVALFVMTPDGTFHKSVTRLDVGEGDSAGDTDLCTGLRHQGGSWHWPART